MNAIERTPFTERLQHLGRELPRPKAILVVSAHWMTSGPQLTGQAQPPTLHDFGGFPKELFAVKYPAPGDPQLALHASSLIPQSSISNEWGLDHGTWSVLVHLYPDASVPVVQLSLDSNRTPEEHFVLGKHLAQLRDENVMILGSGNIVHNLRLLNWRDREAPPPTWASSFSDYVAWAIEHKKWDLLWNIEASQQDPMRLSVPTPEHYLPLLTVAGALAPDERFESFYRAYEFGSLSMDSFISLR